MNETVTGQAPNQLTDDEIKHQALMHKIGQECHDIGAMHVNIKNLRHDVEDRHIKVKNLVLEANKLNEKIQKDRAEAIIAKSKSEQTEVPPTLKLASQDNVTILDGFNVQ